MSRHSDWVESNLRIKRLCPESYVVYSREHGYSERWRAFERMSIPLTMNEDLLAQPGMTKDTECCVCVAPTPTELLHKFSVIKAAQKRNEPGFRLLFRDRVLRGEQERPIPEPPEWAEYKAKMSATVAASKERTTEQIRGTVRNFMAINGLNARDMTREQRAVLGIGRLGDNWKGR